MSQLRLFIASSSKGIRYAKAIKDVVDAEFRAEVCALWKGSFEDGRSFLDTLEQLPRKYDCGVAIFTADDRLGDQMAPRDSVVLEFGLMLGAFGRNRAFLLVEDQPVKIPGDLEGITLTRFFPRPENATHEECRGAVQSACMALVDRLKSLVTEPDAKALRRVEENWRERRDGQDFKLYSFYGLSGTASAGKDGHHEEGVYFLWADADTKSWIHARTMDAGHGFEVEFHNKCGGFPGNVAFRISKKRVPTAVGAPFKRLRFSARAVCDVECAPPGAPPGAGLSLRVVDALTTHWSYCWNRPEYEVLELPPDGSATEFEIELNNRARWDVFCGDGNHLYPGRDPDFSQVLAVVIEFGSITKGRPGTGKGTVQVKNFLLD